jgi:hypothetical protein
MRERTMRWYFEPRRDDDGTRHDEDHSAPGLIDLPAAVLQRHGALVLDPGQAVAVRDQPTPRSTVYRASSLLIPDTLLQDQGFIAAVDRILERVGMNLIPPGQDRDLVDGDGDREIIEALRQLPRPAVLVPARDNPVPAKIDAWIALQTLRAAAGGEKRMDLDETAVQQIGLEHLLVGSAITGSPAGNSGGALTGNNSGVTGPSSTDSYTYAGGDTRTPVAVVFDPPKRNPPGTPEFPRRPVVAVLDTGARMHPWLDVKPDPDGRYSTIDDGFVAIDKKIQQAIYAEGNGAAEAGDRHRQVIKYAWDTRVTADPLVGELDTDTGHCTFISGIVRQVAADAQVLAIRIMHSDGIINEGDLLCALRHLIKRIALAEQGAMATMVDVVSMSFGYFSESDDVAYNPGLRKAIDILLSLGVTVVAAAGNYSTSRRFYPAAFTQQPLPEGQVPLLAVGALNPDGSKALFSNGGRWITTWAAGAAVVSTFPTDINGSRSPEIRMRAHPGNEMPPGSPLPPDREALDLDDYSGGFASWSGTSFSAPLVAAHVAAALLEAAPTLSLPGKQAARDRVLAALENLGWEG